MSGSAPTPLTLYCDWCGSAFEEGDEGLECSNPFCDTRNER